MPPPAGSEDPLDPQSTWWLPRSDAPSPHLTVALDPAAPAADPGAAVDFGSAVDRGDTRAEAKPKRLRGERIANYEIRVLC